MKNRSLLFLALAAVFVLSACNMPGGNSAEQVQTAAAETVSAQFTQNAALTPSATSTPLASATLSATNTPAVSNTPFATSTAGTSGGATGGCDAIQFVSDVTVPDGEDHAPDSAFVKTWRLRNSGTCTWGNTYSLVFVSGNAMGGAASTNLTSSVVPGSTIDISVNLTAPHELGSYTGYWALRNASSQTFGSFYVQIDVTTGGSTGGGSGNTISASNVGQVRSDATTGAGAHAGDTGSNVSVQAFVSFNISSIPNGATIDEVQVDFSNYTTDSNPFATMGCLTANYGVYFPLDALDFSLTASNVDMEWCSKTELSTVFVSDDMKARLQDAVDNGDTTFEYRLFFTGGPTDSDNTADLVRFLDLSLIIDYTE